MNKKNMEPWRKKAIDFLKQSKDSDIRKAIKILEDGKGYLTHTLPIRVVFYEDIK